MAMYFGNTLLAGESTLNSWPNYSLGASTPSFQVNPALNASSGPSSVPAPAGMEAFKTYGPVLAIMGAVQGAIGSYYQAQSQQYQLNSQASNMRFQGAMADLNARGAEFTAEQYLEQGNRQIGKVTMRAGQVKSAQKAAMAANGIQLGEGSAAEVVATTDLMKETDALTINANSVRAAASARAQATNYVNQSMLAGVSANNLSTSANGISPGLAAGTSLLNSATSFAGGWYRTNNIADLLAAYRTRGA